MTEFSLVRPMELLAEKCVTTDLKMDPGIRLECAQRTPLCRGERGLQDEGGVRDAIRKRIKSGEDASSSLSGNGSSRFQNKSHPHGERKAAAGAYFSFVRPKIE